MLRASQVIGLPVISSAEGRQVGTVSNVAYAPSRYAVVGFLLKNAPRDALPSESLQRVTADAVSIRNVDAIVDHNDDPDIADAMNSRISFDALSVLDRDGNQVGTIEDTFFDENTGRVAGFEVGRVGGGGLFETGGRYTTTDYTGMAGTEASGGYSGTAETPAGYTGEDENVPANTKFFLPVGMIVDLSQSGARVALPGNDDALYTQPFPPDYGEPGPGFGRRAA